MQELGESQESNFIISLKAINYSGFNTNSDLREFSRKKIATNNKGQLLVLEFKG